MSRPVCAPGPRLLHRSAALSIALFSLMLASSVRADPKAPAPPPSRLPVAGGEYVLPRALDEITDEQRREIWDAINANIAKLEREGKLAAPTGSHPLLQWPLARWTGPVDSDHHGISGFVDQNPAFPNQLRDYNCGLRTYDTEAGYNHQGVDFFTWPFGFYKMDHFQTAVVATAPGTIVYRSDGNFDRSCQFNTNNWNAVYVRHADNSMAWYGHLKSGSVTTKTVGQTVATGEYLGIVGSSGNSTGPHLHLEVYDSTGNLNETYQGPCNVMNSDSWWASQRPYYDSSVNRVATGFAPPNFPLCPNQESPNAQDVFAVGEPVYYHAFYHDQLVGHMSTYRIYRPDGSLYFEWTHQSPGSYSASWWTFDDPNFAPDGPPGIWAFEVIYQSRTYRHYFAVGDNPPSGGTTGQLVLTKVPASQVMLTWGSSCVAGDTDYEVYEGILGQFTSHAPRICSTGGALSQTLAPQPRPAGSGTYYLVAPTNHINEGSLGRNSSGVEIPPGSRACLTQLVASCP